MATQESNLHSQGVMGTVDPSQISRGNDSPPPGCASKQERHYDRSPSEMRHLTIEEYLNKI